jgi:hypothetical protein
VFVQPGTALSPQVVLVTIGKQKPCHHGAKLRD